MDVDQRFVVTAWRNRQELLQVRHDLYTSDPVRRESALNKVFAWRVRRPDRLPLLLDSTADIVDVIVQDEKGQLKHNALCLLYASAISRFVTGLADTQIDLIRDRPSWFPPGKCLQLPVDLLEIRHRIVHRHLPCLAELRGAARDSLDWLWEWYWSQLDHAFGISKNAEEEDEEESIPMETVRDNLNAVLKAYMKERKNEIKARHEDSKAAETALSSYTLQFTAHGAITSSLKVQSTLLNLLIGEKMLLPTDRKLGSNMSGAFLIWNPFLTTFCTDHLDTCAISTLLDHLIRGMNIPSGVNKEMDPTREGMHEWLVHILTNHKWSPARGAESPKVTQDVLATCFSEPTFWNIKLAASILDKSKVPNHEQWGAVLEAAAATSDDQVELQGGKGEGECLEARGNGVEHGLLAPDAQEKEIENVVPEKKKSVGPRKVEGIWRPRPIGWLPEGWED